MIGDIIAVAPPLASFGGLLLAFALHATVLLGAVWAMERAGWLKHPHWAELAWRIALFGAFVSVAIEAVPFDPSRTPSASPVVAETVATPSTMPSRVEPAPRADGLADMKADPPAAAISAIATRSTADAAVPAADAVPALALPVATDALLLALLLWCLGSVVLLLRVLHQMRALLRMRRRVLREGRPASAATTALLHDLAEEMGLTAPALRVLPVLDSPMVLPGVVLLPHWAESLAVAQRRAMLAHELAHLDRRDPLWRPLQRLALVPLFFHPLAWHALRRLETLAEMLCDRAAAERGAGRALAECLAECLARSAQVADDRRHPSFDRGAALALAMAERGDGIVPRVRTLLENPHMTLSKIPTRWRWAAAALALFALIALPGVMVVARPGMMPGLFERHDLSITIRNKGQTHAIRSDMPGMGETLRVLIDGDVAFNDAESDVATLGRGAVFEIEQTHAGVSRSLRMTPGTTGAVREYKIDGAVRPFDAGAQAWLAATIPQIYRLSALDAEARAKRILARGGAGALLAEIAQLQGDYVRAEYLGQFFAHAAPDEAQTAKALTLVRAIRSDFEKRRALGIALSRPVPSPQQAALLSIAAEIDSDFERAEWLIEAAAKLPVDGGNAEGWSRALRGLGSDFERRRALTAVIEDGQPRAAALALALRTMRGMSSDFERRSVLEVAADADVPLPDADYLAAVDAMSSDFERREALAALIRGGTPSAERSRAILRSVRAMSSDFERGEVLNALAETMPNDPMLIEDYRAVTRGMSDHERGRAEKALDRFYGS